MSWSTSSMPSQSGRVAIVTGANSGLGLETARELARRGAHVVMGVRDLAKGATAESDIKRSVPEASTSVVELDLGSLASVASFAGQVTDRHPAIDLLVNNAGVMGTPRLETADGFELQFGTNHLGHFALTARLAPALFNTPRARIVTVTSTARHFRWLYDETDIHLETRYDPWRAYGRSKIANLHFAVELNNRLAAAEAPAISLVAHPGFSNTNLQATSARHSPGGGSQAFFHNAVQRFGMSPPQGALPQLRALTDPRARGGELYAPRWVSFGPPVRRPLSRWSIAPGPMKQLWGISERLTEVTLDVASLIA